MRLDETGPIGVDLVQHASVGVRRPQASREDPQAERACAGRKLDGRDDGTFGIDGADRSLVAIRDPEPIVGRGQSPGTSADVDLPVGATLRSSYRLISSPPYAVSQIDPDLNAMLSSSSRNRSTVSRWPVRESIRWTVAAGPPTA